MIQKKKFSEAIAANISVVEELINLMNVKGSIIESGKALLTTSQVNTTTKSGLYTITSFSENVDDWMKANMLIVLTNNLYCFQIFLPAIGNDIVFRYRPSSGTGDAWSKYNRISSSSFVPD